MTGHRRIVLAFVTCTACGKRTYRTRRIARRVAKLVHPSEHMQPHPCRYGGTGWHLGHWKPRADQHDPEGPETAPGCPISERTEQR